MYICPSQLLINHLAVFYRKGSMVDPKEAVELAKHFKKELKEKQGDWKSKFSGAFNSEQIFFSLLVLGLFYVGYTIASVEFDVNSRHEDDVIESCYCKSSNRNFYLWWFISWSIIWFFIHVYTYVAVRFRKLEKILKATKAVCHGAPKSLLKCSKGLLKSCYKFCCKCKSDKETTAESVMPRSNPDSGSNLNSNIIHHYIEVLWFQYYKLFVVGYTKGKDENVFLDHLQVSDADIAKIPKKAREDKEMITCLCFSAYIIKDSTNEQQQQAAENCSCGCDKKFSTCFNFIKNLYITCLVLVKFITQYLTLPLLFLQIFDTYALLCFSPDLFCLDSNTSEYKLHLAQAVITLLFYCCLALSQLASTMLSWNPWPKKDDEYADEKVSIKDTDNL